MQFLSIVVTIIGSIVTIFFTDLSIYHKLALTIFIACFSGIICLSLELYQAKKALQDSSNHYKKLKDEYEKLNSNRNSLDQIINSKNYEIMLYKKIVDEISNLLDIASMIPSETEKALLTQLSSQLSNKKINIIKEISEYDKR